MEHINALTQIEKPLTFFLVGATGDLAKKKLWKALFQLFQLRVLPHQWKVVGLARAQYSQEGFVEFIHAVIQPQSQALWQDFCAHVTYQRGDVTQKETFEKLAKAYQSEKENGDIIWYVATLPGLYLAVISNIKQSGMAQNPHGWSKLLLEKPFGTDLETAQALNKTLLSTFKEDQIYRIDHFLAKETVQNILIFRFANGIFENLWSYKSVDHIQIDATETLGVTGRETFYDATGTLRDVVQNHVLQMLATTLMEEPTSLQPETIREKRYELLSKLSLENTNKPFESAVFGQYTHGVVEAEAVKGYLEEKGIAKTSQTETAVALKLAVHNERWSGVPIYVKAGKRLDRYVTQISMHFKERSNRMFYQHKVLQTPNVLTFRIAPNESVSVKLSVKKPGLELAMQEVPLQFHYKNEFQMELVEAYVKLLHDAIKGDSTLFSHAKDIEETWRVIDPLLEHTTGRKKRLFPYPAGTQGPKEFGELVVSDR